MALIQEGRLEEGVQELEVAYDLLPHPNVLYNIARAYAEAGQYEQAIEFYERYLDTDPSDREEVNLFVRALDQRLRMQRELRESVAEPATPTPAEGQPTAVTATAEEIQALEDSATQIATLAEATQSEALRQRAERLRALAQSLREREVAPTTPTTVAEAEPTTPRETPEARPPELTLTGEGREDLYEEQVVSASRFAQSPLDAPNSTATITRQDIRLSGIKHIGELMRRVAGADVMTISPADVQLSMRGFNDRLSQRMLVLVDGRSTYLDYLGVTFLARLPLSVDDIERIEIIRGPASALYGANAFVGVVNIITREPGTPETTAIGGAGTGGQAYGQIATSGRVQRKLAYRVAAGYNRADVFQTAYDPRRADLVTNVDDPNLSFENAHMNGTLKYRLLKNLEATLQGGVASNNSDYSTRGPRDPFRGTGTTSHIMGLLESNWGQVRAFWNRADEDAVLVAMPLGADDFTSRSVSNVFDVDATLSRAFRLGVDHNFHLGGNYRQKRISWNYLEGDQTENHYAVYTQDTATITKWLTLVGSFRADFHPLLDDPPLSPRGAAIIKPTPLQAIRLSAGTAFRTPTFVESYFQFRTPTAPALFVETRGIANTNSSINPERMLSLELGYQNTESPIFKGEANAYYNRITDLISADPGGVYRAGSTFIADPSYQGLAPADNAFALNVGRQVNLDDKYDVFGGELIGTLYPMEGVDVYANYALNLVNGPDESYTKRVSRHKLNLGAQYRSPYRFDLSADVHVASGQTWYLPTPTFVDSAFYDVPAYYMINARIGFRMLADQLELGLAGYNITDNRIQQHPFGQQLSARFMLTAALRI